MKKYYISIGIVAAIAWGVANWPHAEVLQPKTKKISKSRSIASVAPEVSTSVEDLIVKADVKTSSVEPKAEISLSQEEKYISIHRVLVEKSAYKYRGVRSTIIFKALRGEALSNEQKVALVTKEMDFLALGYNDRDAYDFELEVFNFDKLFDAYVYLGQPSRSQFYNKILELSLNHQSPEISKYILAKAKMLGRDEYKNIIQLQAQINDNPIPETASAQDWILER